MTTYIGIGLMLVGAIIAALGLMNPAPQPVALPLEQVREWPEVAPDGVTPMPGMNVWAKIAGEENKWVMWTRAPDGGVTWLYARATEIEIPASTQTIFSEIEGLPWPKHERAPDPR